MLSEKIQKAYKCINTAQIVDFQKWQGNMAYDSILSNTHNQWFHCTTF